MNNDIIELTKDMLVFEPLPAGEIERRAAAVLAAASDSKADYDNSFDINHCVDIGCNKAQDGCCLGYHNPIVLLWHKQGLACPTGPWAPMFSEVMKAKKVNPLKASKRANQ